MYRNKIGGNVRSGMSFYNGLKFLEKYVIYTDEIESIGSGLTSTC